VRIQGEVKPSCGVLTHFGISILNARPEEEAAYLKAEIGVLIAAARDGLNITLDHEITIREAERNEKSHITIRARETIHNHTDVY